MNNLMAQGQAESDTANTTAGRGDEPPLSVLLVEDSPYLALRLREILGQTRRATEVVIVESEGDAVTALLSIHPRVMILDLHLKSGTGFGVLSAMEKMPGPRPLVVVLTNYATPQYERAVKAYNVPYFLDKAKDFQRLPDILQEVD